MKKNIDYLIVGQGIAGSILAYTALMNKKTIAVISSDKLNSSSMVAAGIINSVVIKRLTKSWRADEFNNYLINFYPLFEEYLQVNIFHSTNTLKLISSLEEENFWIYRRQKENMDQYLSADITSTMIPDSFNFRKAANIFQTYLLEFIPLLQNFNKKLIEDKLLLNEQFDYSKLIINKNTVQYKGINANQIIFCEGAHAVQNPFFNWLPFSLNKGEILTIKSNNLQLDSVINKKIFILPTRESYYKLGSTYEWIELDDKPTAGKRKEIIENFKKMSAATFSISDQKAGIRPATKDRRPFLGSHPQYKNLYIFNGLGAKAGLMAPLLSKELLDFIENKGALNKECSIERYSKLYKIDSFK